MIFFIPILFCLFPIFYYTANDFSNYPDYAVNSTQHELDSVPYFAWIFMVSGIFILFRIMSFGSRQAFDLNTITRVFYDVSFLYIATDIEHKMSMKIFGIYFFYWIFIFAALFTATFHIAKKYDITITKQSLETTPTRIVLFASAVFFVYMTSYFLASAWAVSIHFFSLYIIVYIAVLLVHGILVYAAFENQHFHHWYSALLASHACVFVTEGSAVSQAFFFAVYIHGAGTFGTEPVFPHIV